MHPYGRLQLSPDDYEFGLPSGEPVLVSEGELAPEVIAEVIEILKVDWLVSERDRFHQQLQHDWTPPDSERMGSEMIQVYSRRQEEGDDLLGISKLLHATETYFCNKATVFYWMESAKINRSDVDGLVILGSIWNTWVDALGRQPNFQLNDFFAVPVNITNKVARSQYVETVPEILRAHVSICSQVREAFEKKESRWWRGRDSRFFSLHPLCEAMIVVFDEYKFVQSGYVKQADGFRHYENVAQHQSVLMIRTGKEDNLSAPISFDS
ncbi:uncharacterized protein LY89DRAFT_782000 [Mollisia scopiformis]|uniref:Uncharacterized protein n=1 Tax=Mollisia scopiformis TaxID=149040 RepID=A0A194X959_MOLSC|nr:uncharacterized protein LY89DRAFT_782000 [Mollisia scopiformis]KUJ16711.1 hypothetical protein LY89DRAFT_782000 [Mollisia scopiformis]